MQSPEKAIETPESTPNATTSIEACVKLYEYSIVRGSKPYFSCNWKFSSEISTYQGLNSSLINHINSDVSSGSSKLLNVEIDTRLEISLRVSTRPRKLVENDEFVETCFKKAFNSSKPGYLVILVGKAASIRKSTNISYTRQISASSSSEPSPSPLTVLSTSQASHQQDFSHLRPGARNMMRSLAQFRNSISDAPRNIETPESKVTTTRKPSVESISGDIHLYLSHCGSLVDACEDSEQLEDLLHIHRKAIKSAHRTFLSGLKQVITPSMRQIRERSVDLDLDTLNLRPIDSDFRPFRPGELRDLLSD